MTARRQRYRCHHPSGKGKHPYCMKTAVGAVLVGFPFIVRGREIAGHYKWSKPLPACAEHHASRMWYKNDAGIWCPVQHIPLETYVHYRTLSARERLEFRGSVRSKDKKKRTPILRPPRKG